MCVCVWWWWWVLSTQSTRYAQNRAVENPTFYEQASEAQADWYDQGRAVGTNDTYSQATDAGLDGGSSDI